MSIDFLFFLTVIAYDLLVMFDYQKALQQPSLPTQ